jgi:hypothetical protein
MKQFRDTPYYVTEDGKVISTKFGKTKELKQFINDGYCQVALRINNKQKNFTVSRLVAEVYHPNPNNLPEVDHKDCNKLNNHISNLEWVTGQENLDRAKKNGLFNNVGEKNGNHTLTKEQVIWIRNNYKPYDKEFGGIPLGKKFNISSTIISFIVHGKRWKHI